MIDSLKKIECCGCNACGDVCPQGAISYERDNEGFLNPFIDHSKCVDCGLCDKVCPSINIETLKKNDFVDPKCFAAINKNLNIRFDSTSGGIFSALAKKAYKRGWYVGGAIWNKDWTVSQFISNDKNDLKKIRSSKYIQSDAQGLYISIKALLSSGENVLICGTPCQIAALKSYLKKPYSNLVTVDFICQYVNSPFIWAKYIEYLEGIHNSRVVYIKDKNKEIGWRTLCNKVVFENGDVVYDTKDENQFRRCYMQLGIASRPSCYHCQFKGFPRIADITIADYWGGEKYVPKDFDNDLGTSLIMCNSQKGLDFIDDEVKKKLEIIDVPLESTLSKNKALTLPFSPIINFDRNKFYEDLKDSDIKTVVDEYIHKYKTSTKSEYKRRIKNILKFWKTIVVGCGFRPYSIFKNIWYNFFSNHITTSITDGHFIFLAPYCKLKFGVNSKILVAGNLSIGVNELRNEGRVSKIILRENARWDVRGNYTFSAGCDIQIFKDATFVIEGDGDANSNSEIVCGKEITFQRYVYLGRNVIIRDTNGEHFISRQGYKTSRPVIIGTHAWICDRSTIMPGVHIWPGGIIGASSYVVTDVPAFSLVSGNPATVVDEEVYWKA